MINKPTLDQLDKDTEAYTNHIKNSGEPITITMELLPWDDGLKWSIKGAIPDGVRDLVWIIHFTHYIKEAIIEAIKPPEDKEAQNEPSR